MRTEEPQEIFLTFNYPELKDLGKHFLTISSATAIFVVTFFDKIASQAAAGSPNQGPLVTASIVALLVSIICAGVGLFTNYIAGAGAAGAIIWGAGRNFRMLTTVTYILYMIAGLGLVSAYSALAMTVMSN